MSKTPAAQAADAAAGAVHLQPAVCVGAVMHERHTVANNRFVYPSAFLRLPLSRIDDLKVPLLGIERSNFFSFRRRDHGPRDGSALLPWLLSALDAHGVRAVCDGEVVLQTMPRVFGYVFNPVSFWFCHDRDGALRDIFIEMAGNGRALVQVLGALPARVLWIDEREADFPASVPANVEIIVTDTPDAELRAEINQGLVAVLRSFIADQKSGVSSFISDQVKSWDMGQLIALIEINIGKDLQYIRFNGSLIGGLAGLALYTVELLVRML